MQTWSVKPFRQPYCRVACPCRLKWIATSAMLFLGVLTVLGSPAGTADYLIDLWTSDNGLPDSSVTAIAQTPDGYLWIGTYNGLARFDGVQFVTFDPFNTPALKHARCGRAVCGRTRHAVDQHARRFHDRLAQWRFHPRMARRAGIRRVCTHESNLLCHPVWPAGLSHRKPGGTRRMAIPHDGRCDDGEFYPPGWFRHNLVYDARRSARKNDGHQLQRRFPARTI